MPTNNPLKLDPAAETERLTTGLREAVYHTLKKRGVVLGISGGVDSSVALSLCVRVFGPQRLVALILPEKDSSDESEQFARELAAGLGVEPVKEDITAALEGFGCYRRRDEAVRRVFPEYDAAAGYKVKIVLPPNLLAEGGLNIYSVTIVGPDGKTQSKPLPPAQFLQIVAASNFKQRTRMAFLYHHAELRNYAVIGTANKNEHDQGFFVKHGDSGVDIRLLGHLFKSQIYQLAAYLGVPESIRQRAPTSDTYSAPCTQQEFFFRLPFELHDQLLYLAEHGTPVETAARESGLSESEVERALADIHSKRRATGYLRTPPLDLGIEAQPISG